MIILLMAIGVGFGIGAPLVWLANRPSTRTEMPEIPPGPSPLRVMLIPSVYVIDPKRANRYMQ